MIKSIEVTDFEGKKINLLSKYKNTALLLLFYNNSCLGCTGRAIPLAYKFQQQYSFVQIIGIHSNFNTNHISEDDIKSIFTTKEIPFPIYIDENHKEYDSFKSEGTPQWILITKTGELFKSIFGSQLGAQNRLYYALESLKNE